MANFSLPSTLTPVLVHQTELVAPQLVPVKTAAGNMSLEEEPSSTRKVAFHVCSELAEHSAPVQAFTAAASSKLEFVNDEAGQPMVFGIDQDGRFNLLVHVDNAPLAWQIFDITPGPSFNSGRGLPAVTFDAHCYAGWIAITVATRNPDTSSRLFHLEIKQPLFECKANGEITPSVDGLITSLWNEITTQGPQHISSLLYRFDDKGSKILVGTENPFTHSIVDPAQSPLVWRSLPLPEQGARVVQMDVAQTNEGSGYFVFYKMQDKVWCTQENLSTEPDVLNPVRTDKRLLGLTSVGNISSIYANKRPDSYTDLYIAGDQGIGFWDGEHILTQQPKILVQGAFKQVIASEDYDHSNPKARSQLSVFAISIQDELYYMQGTRDLATRVGRTKPVEFKWSGIPIRTEVAQLCCSFDHKVGVVDATYFTFDAVSGGKLKHLSKVPTDTSQKYSTASWTEVEINVPAPRGAHVTYPAYLTHITCYGYDGQNKAALPGYRVRLSSENTFQAIVNDRLRRIGQKAVEVVADSQGLINIVTRVEDLLGSPKLLLTGYLYTNPGAEKTISVYPAQRVMRGLSQVTDADSLIGAKNAKGETPFAHLGKTDAGKEQATTVAGVTNQFGMVLDSVDKDAVSNLHKPPPPPPADDGDQSVLASWELLADGTLKKLDGSWIGRAVHKVIEIVEDVIEWIRGKIKTLVKMALKLVGKAIHFLLEIGGKLVAFVIRTASHLVHAFAKFLKDYLNIDISGLLNWLGFLFDIENIRKTQDHLITFVHQLKDTTLMFLEGSRVLLVGELKAVRDLISQTLDLTKAPGSSYSENDGSGFAKIFQTLMENPVLSTLRKFSPGMWLIDTVNDAAKEEVESWIEVPSVTDFASFFTDTMLKSVDEELVVIWNLVKDIAKDIKEAINSPEKALNILTQIIGKILLAIVDSGVKIIDAVIKIMEQLFTSVFKMLEGTWKIPFVTDVWDGLIEDQPFSLLNAGTFVMAFGMNLVYSGLHPDHLPFDNLPDPSQVLKNINRDFDFIAAMAKRRPVDANDTTHGTVRAMAMKSSSTTNAMPVRTLDFDGFMPPIDLDYDQAKSDYHKWQAIIGVLTAVGKGMATIWNVFGGWQVSGAPGENETPAVSEKVKNRQEQSSSIALANQNFFYLPGVMAAIVQLMGSAASTIVYFATTHKSDRWRHELDSDPAIFPTYMVNICLTVPGAAIGIANLIAHNAYVDATSAAMLNFADIPRQVSFTGLRHHMLSMDVPREIHTARVRLTGDYYGAVANVAGPFKEEPPMFAVWLVATGVSSVCTLGTGMTDFVEYLAQDGSLHN